MATEPVVVPFPMRWVRLVLGIILIVLGILGLLHVIPFTETIFWALALVVGAALVL